MKKNNKYILRNRKRFFSFLFLISLVVSILVYTTSVSGYKEPQYQYISIESGDTLWSIAEKYGTNSNIRKFIHEIKEVNNMESDLIYSNTTLLVPVEK